MIWILVLGFVVVRYANCQHPRPMSATPIPLPARAATSKARRRSPVQRQTAERRSLPPSSGAVGSGLNTASRWLIAASQPMTRPGPGPTGRQQQRAETTEQQRHQQAEGGTGRGDPELAAPAAWLAAQPGHPAEHPQGDAVDVLSLMAGHHGVRQLVPEQAGEEGDGGTQADRAVGPRRPSRVCLGELPRGQQRGDQAEIRITVQFAPTAMSVRRPRRQVLLIATRL